MRLIAVIAVHTRTPVVFYYYYFFLIHCPNNTRERLSPIATVVVITKTIKIQYKYRNGRTDPTARNCAR